MLRINNSIEPIEVIQKHYNLNYHVLESMADGVRVMDDNYKVIYENSALRDIFGESTLGSFCKINCRGCSDLDENGLACGRQSPCGLCIIERSILDGEIHQKEEVINGRYYSVKSSPVKNQDKKIIGAVEVFRNVTRERTLEQELRSKNQKMHRDLEIARMVQERILPKKGIIGNINIEYVYQPSEVLSGDMFDVFRIDEDNVGIYISDVVGHGVAASMMTMFIRQSMRFIKDDILSPSIALTELHRRFKNLDMEMDKYFTIFYGVFNTKTYQFKYANAGHNSIPIKFNRRRDELELLKIPGFPISFLFDEIDYEEDKIQLEKDDKILFYTDGILEMEDHDGIQFGIENIIKTIKNTKVGILEELEYKLNNYSMEGKVDDFAAMLMEVID